MSRLFMMSMRLLRRLGLSRSLAVGGYDVMIITHIYIGLAKSTGLLRELDKSMIPNLMNLDPPCCWSSR